MKKNWTMILLTIALGLGLSGYVGVRAPEAVQAAEGLALYVGSPLVLAGETVKPLDSADYAITPVLSHDRTLVPLRAISEHFGAEVTYDTATKTATIVYNGKTATLTVGEATLTIDGTTTALDVAPTIRDERMFLPLRAVAEQLLGKTVSYLDRAILIGDEGLSLSADGQKTIAARIGAAYTFANNGEYAAYMTAHAGDQTNERYTVSSSIASGSSASSEKGMEAADQAAPQENAAAETDDSASYTDTNVQVAGVDEGDVVKTDGKYLYAVSGQSLSIVETGGAGMILRSQTDFPENVSVQDLYLDGNTLTAVGYQWTPYTDDGDMTIQNDVMRTSMIWRGSSQVWVGVYNVTDKEEPQLSRETIVDGSLTQTRKVGNILYLVTSLYTGDQVVYPMLEDQGASNKLAAEDITCIAGEAPEQMIQVSAINTRDLTAPVTAKAFLGSGYELYMTKTALYIAGTEYDWEDGKDQSTTHILKVAVDGTNIGYAASGEVDGYLLNQWAMDESGDSLRVATTDGDGNNLFVLDSSLTQIGALTGLAEGERIYAVRYQGDTAYMVTFVQTDPLFVIDLSDPENPQLKGELELPGFSSYLHPVGENLLLGIGYDTETVYSEDRTGKRTVIGTRNGGLKLSLFDVSDPENPQETNEVVLGESGTWADATNDHKALMADDVNHRYGFGVSLTQDGEYTQGALVFSVVNGNLDVTGVAKVAESDDGYDKGYLNRLVTINDTLYYLYMGQIYAYQAKDLSVLNTLSL